MTVRGLLTQIDSRELAEWMAYDRIEPFGESRADLRMGILASLTASAAGVKNAKPADFMPDFEPRRHKSWQEDRDHLKNITAALGGRHGGI